MSEVITDDIRSKVKRLAKKSVVRLEPICQECWENNKDDPFGVESGIDTPARKEITSIIEQVIETNSEATQTWYNDIEYELEELFYEYRKQYFKSANVKVNNSLQCWYCFEENKRPTKRSGAV